MAKKKFLLIGNALDQFLDASPHMAALSFSLSQHFTLYLEAINEVKLESKLAGHHRKSLDGLAAFSVQTIRVLEQSAGLITKVREEIKEALDS